MRTNCPRPRQVHKNTTNNLAELACSYFYGRIPTHVIVSEAERNSGVSNCVLSLTIEDLHEEGHTYCDPNPYGHVEMVRAHVGNLVRVVLDTWQAPEQ